MTKEQILEHIRNAPLPAAENAWSEIAEMYASALSNVSDRLTAIEMAEFVAVGMLARRHIAAGDAQGAPVLNFLQREAQFPLF